MPFLRYNEERGHIVRVAKIVAKYVGVSSSNLSVASLNCLAFDKPFDRSHVYSSFDY